MDNDSLALELDAKNDTIAQLRQELIYSRDQASQDVQTARILAGQTAEVDALYNRLSSCPVPTTPVYGRTPIFTCNDLANLYIIKEHLEKRDLLPESNMDEDLTDIQSMLVRYMMDRDIVTLNIILSTLCKMISELYHTCDSQNEKIEFEDFIKNINNIIK